MTLGEIITQAMFGTSENADMYGEQDPNITGGLTATGAMGAALSMGSHKITGLSAGTANGDSVRFEQVYIRGVNMWVGYKTVTADGSGQFYITIPGMDGPTNWVAIFNYPSGHVGSVGYGLNQCGGKLYDMGGTLVTNVSTTIYYIVVYNG